jgi:hypothetical protein
MAEQVARWQGGQLSQGTLRWASAGGHRRPRVVSGGGGRRAFCFWRLGRQVDTGGARGGTGDGKEEERERQGNTGGGVGEMARCLCQLGLGGQDGRAGCLGRRISGPNLRSEWVRADAFGQLYLFGSPRCVDTFRPRVVV